MQKSKNEDDFKIDDNFKNEDDLKNEGDFKIGLLPKIILPPLPLKNYLKFSWWLLILTATQQLMLNLKWYQVSKPEMEFHMKNTIYAALTMCAHFPAKMTRAKQSSM